jgi:FKBP-type peptidyl-prolyl cis-trans isomerase FklB
MNLKSVVIILLASTFVFSSCKRQPVKVKLRTDIDSVSYCLGLSVGRSLKEQSNLEKINSKLLAEAIDQVYNKDSIAFDPTKVNLVLNNYFQKLHLAASVKVLKEGKDFLEKNKSQSGIKVLPDGLQYQVIKEGDGPIPAPTDIVKVHYTGTTIDGKKFDSSLDRKEPAQFAVNQVIKGWSEALSLMKVGSKWKIFVPSELAYGERGAGNVIKPNSVLIFDVELISIEKPAPAPDAAPAAAQKGAKKK